MWHNGEGCAVGILTRAKMESNGDTTSTHHASCTNSLNSCNLKPTLKLEKKRGKRLKTLGQNTWCPSLKVYVWPFWSRNCYKNKYDFIPLLRMSGWEVSLYACCWKNSWKFFPTLQIWARLAPCLPCLLINRIQLSTTRGIAWLESWKAKEKHVRISKQGEPSVRGNGTKCEELVSTGQWLVHRKVSSFSAL